MLLLVIWQNTNVSRLVASELFIIIYLLMRIFSSTISGGILVIEMYLVKHILTWYGFLGQNVHWQFRRDTCTHYAQTT